MRRVFNVFKFAVKALTILGNEIFRLTNATRGCLLLIVVFFYSAYVLGVALWVESGSPENLCGTLGECMYTMMRLAFFDDKGFDYAYSLTQHHFFLFLVTMLYMCITAFGILNGLIGIFGGLFNSASQQSFRDEAEEGDDEEEVDFDEFCEEEGRKYGKENYSYNNKCAHGPRRPRHRRSKMVNSEDESLPLQEKDKPKKRRQIGVILRSSFLSAANRLITQPIKFVKKTVHTSRRDLKLQRTASKFLFSTYFGRSGKLTNDSKVHPITFASQQAEKFKEVEPAREIRDSREKESLLQTYRLVTLLHSHSSVLQSKLDAQGKLLADLYANISTLNRELEKQQTLAQATAEKHQQQLENLHNIIATNNFNLQQQLQQQLQQLLQYLQQHQQQQLQQQQQQQHQQQLSQQDRYEEWNQHQMEVSIFDQQYPQSQQQPIFQRSPVQQRDRTGAHRHSQRSPIPSEDAQRAVDIASLKRLPNVALTSQPASEDERDNTVPITIDSVLDGNDDSPRSQLTFNTHDVELESIADTPMSSKKVLPALHVPHGRHYLPKLRVEGGYKPASYDYLPHSVRAKMASMHQVIHTSDEY